MGSYIVKYALFIVGSIIALFIISFAKANYEIEFKLISGRSRPLL